MPPAKIASRCLITLARAKVPGGPAVAAWNPPSQSIQIVRLPRRDLVMSAVMGAAANDSFVFLAVQIADGLRPYFYGGSFFLLVLNRADLSFAALHPLENLRDVHSICLHQHRLYLVSTGTDEVIALELDGANIVGQTVAWRPIPEAPREDLHHLNTLVSWNGSLIVSGFGEKSGPLWSSATNGFLHDITTGQRLLSGIAQPHSMLPMGGDLLICESLVQSVRTLYSGRRVRLDGYTRGLGSPPEESRSASAVGGAVPAPPISSTTGEAPEEAGASAESIGLHKEGLDVEGFTDLGFCSDEIYEILPIDGFGVWTFTPELEWRDAAIAGFDLATERLRLQYDQQIAEYQSALDKLNLEMCSKIGEANEIIGSLYQKLDEQSQWAQRTSEEVEERDRIIRVLQRQLEASPSCQ